MRLLNVRTLEFEEFVGGDGNTPLYAILSHTWGSEEVTYRDHSQENALNKKGYEKIKGCCRVAELEGFRYVWIDTCCIDKSSSAELSEAINSMFQWYRRAGICYAYLNDVNSSEDPFEESSSFHSSRWFTRGWTLQELLAPLEVVFLASDWTEIGSKRSLSGPVSNITGIGEKALEESRWSEYSVAQKMSWAAGRKTTRPEDEAYCLMGLFDVNMPLLYGEGHKAFWRLQQEILKQSEDQSIFAWSYPQSTHSHTRLSGLLAPSPECFKDASRIDVMSHQPLEDDETLPEVVNRLVRIRMRLLDQVEAIGLKLVKTKPLLYEMTGVKSALNEVKPQHPAEHICPAVHTREGAQETSNFTAKDDSTLPTIAVSLWEDNSLESITDTAEAVSSSPEPLNTQVNTNMTRQLSPELSLSSEPERWRWYIYEPIIVVPLRCHTGGYQLAILLTRGIISYAIDGVLSRLHNPSVVIIKKLADFHLSPLTTIYAAISGSPDDGPDYNVVLHRLYNPRPDFDHYSWPDIRIAALMNAGYVPQGNSSPNWVLDRSQAAIVHQRKLQYQEDMTNNHAVLVLFSHTSGDDETHPMFFISVSSYVMDDENGPSRGEMDVEVGIFGPGGARAAGLEYKLFGFDLAQLRRVDVPLMNGKHVVLKFREAAAIRFLTVSVELLRRGASFSETMIRAESKSTSLLSRLFPIVRSMR